MGAGVGAELAGIDARRHYVDGLNTRIALRASPVNHTDAAGLFIGMVGLFAPTSTMDVYADYNTEAINAGLSMQDRLTQMLDDYAIGQLMAAEMVGDLSISDNILGSFTAGGVPGAVKVNRHHIIPRFLLALDDAANILLLPEGEHGRYHRILEAEFRNRGLNAVSSGRENRWVKRLENELVKPDEMRKVRAALRASGKQFDIETNGKYGLESKIRRNLNTTRISPRLQLPGRRR